MRAAISGAGGFIGSALSAHLTANGWTVFPLSRDILSLPSVELAAKLEGIQVIINLAGAPIVSRWTRSRKEVLYKSRILTTRKIAIAIRLMKVPPLTLISGSAVGIYTNTGIHTELACEFATDFLGKLCEDWEYEALKIIGLSRVILLRTGVVLGPGGGALEKMLPPFRLGLGGIIASGKQGFSWIHLEDMLRAIEFLATHEEIFGPVNITAPEPVDNRSFTKTLGSVLHRPALIPVPAIALKLLYGEGSVAVTKGQTAYPEKLLQAGFNYRFRSLRTALEDILSSPKA